jgi:hypothetical protein
MYRMHAEAHEGVSGDRWAFVSAELPREGCVRDALRGWEMRVPC